MKESIKSFIFSHLRELPSSLKDVWSTKIASVMTISVIGIALALPCIFMVLFANIKALSGSLETSTQVSVFLKSTVSDEKREQLAQFFKTSPHISKVQYVSKEEALKELKEGLKAENALNLLPENPLPSVFVLFLPLTIDEQVLTSYIQSLRTLPEIENVVIDMDWVKRLGAGLNILNRLVTGLTLILSLAVLMVIGNTLRLHIENKKNSIEVAKLVGATDAFVRRPFLYLGFWYGIMGSFLALCITILLFSWLKNAASQLLALYQSSVQFEAIGFQNAALLLILGAVLGIGGAWLSVGSQLRSIKPT